MVFFLILSFHQLDLVFFWIRTIKRPQYHVSIQNLIVLGIWIPSLVYKIFIKSIHVVLTGYTFQHKLNPVIMWLFGLDFQTDVCGPKSCLIRQTQFWPKMSVFIYSNIKIRNVILGSRINFSESKL